MFKKIIQIFKIPDLRKKILVVLGIFAVFRMMANIPIPGIDAEKLEPFFNQFQVFRLINVFAGGALEKLSIVMLGLGPYITATVILQLLSMIFPQLERLYKEEGEAGREKFEQYSRILTVPLAALQGYAMLALFQKQMVIGELSPFLIFSSISTITAGTLFLMWLGEIISEKGIGNGVSLLIFAGIIADFPQSGLGIYADIRNDITRIPSYLIFFLFALLMIFGVTLINQARRNVSISYTRRVRGRRLYGGARSYLPLSVNPAGVMPIIFALSLLTFPGMIANFFAATGTGTTGRIAQQIINFLQTPLVNGLLYFILVFVFSFFYTMVVFDPKSISDNLKKVGGFIPGIRPGDSTAAFLSYVLNRILPIGALFLGIIALSPSLIAHLTKVVAFQFLVGGTSLLILVSVVLETYQQIKAYLEMREI